MPRNNQYNTGAIYITQRLQRKLECMLTYPCSLMEAPMGYGKTTAVREYLKTTDALVMWLKIFDHSIDGFWVAFCKLFQELDETCADSLKQMGFPEDTASREEALRLLLRIRMPEKTIIVLDDYHLVDKKEVNRFVEFLLRNELIDFKLIMIVRYTSLEHLEELRLKGFVHHITKTDLELKAQEIIAYYRLCGIDIKEQQSEQLYSYTEGWVSALYLLMLSYEEEGSFATTPNITRLIEKAIYRPFSDEIKEFLFQVCLFDRFGIELAVHMWQKENTKQLLDELTGKNVFINYDNHTREYQIHRVLLDFLNELWGITAKESKQACYQRAAHWYLKSKNYLVAIRYFYQAQDFDSILRALEEEKGHSFHNEQKTELIQYMEECPSQIRQQHPIALLIYALCLFTYYEMELFAEVCEEFLLTLESNPDLETDMVTRLMGEYEVLLSFTGYNDIAKMNKHIIKADEYLMRSVDFIDTREEWTFGAPSVLYMFYREVGRLEADVCLLKEALPTYNRLTNGHGKGGDFVMEAEQYYYRGDYDSAEITIHKAHNLAKSQEQEDIMLCCSFLQAKIALIKGDYVTATKLLKKQHEEMEQNKWYHLLYTLELCETFLQAAVQQKDEIPVWIREGDFEASWLYFPTMAFLNIIYGRVLLIQGEYLKILGNADQFMETASIFPNLLGQIYSYIYIAAANEKIIRREEALETLKQALAMALPDKLYLPFVENGDYLKPLLEILEKDGSLEEPIQTILNLYLPYEAALEDIRRECGSEGRIALTEREKEVALLAAKGLSNREIGQQLYISQNTVKSVLKKVFEKLEITSRTMLKQNLLSGID